MQKITLKTYGDSTQEITLSDKAEKILANIGNATEVNDTKSALFSLILGIAQISVTTIHQFNEIPINQQPVITDGMLSGLYLIGDVYEFFDNLEDLNNE